MLCTVLYMLCLIVSPTISRLPLFDYMKDNSLTSHTSSSAAASPSTPVQDPEALEDHWWCHPWIQESSRQILSSWPQQRPLLAVSHSTKPWLFPRWAFVSTQDELVHISTLHYTTIHWTLECTCVSHKKLHQIAREHDEAKRADFIGQMVIYSPEELGFIDEVSRDERVISRRYGRAHKLKSPNCLFKANAPPLLVSSPSRALFVGCPLRAHWQRMSSWTG